VQVMCSFYFLELWPCWKSKKTDCTNCTDISFKEDSNESSLTQATVIQTSKDGIDAAVGNFFNRTGESLARKNMLNLLNPKYAKEMPSFT
jgi:hypothetical protein